MLEIDTVQRAIESHHPFEVVDEISDKYFELIELATRPNLTDANRASIQRRRSFLEARESQIIDMLNHGQWLAKLGDEGGSLAEAYMDTLAQVDQVVAIT